MKREPRIRDHRLRVVNNQEGESMKTRVMAGASLFVAGAGAASAAIFLSGAGAPPTSVIAAAEVRIAALQQQLDSAQTAASEAQWVLDFWEREATESDSNLSRLSTYTPGDNVGPILFDRAKQLAFRSSYSLQDAKLKAWAAQQKVAHIRAQLISPP